MNINLYGYHACLKRKGWHLKYDISQILTRRSMQAKFIQRTLDDVIREQQDLGRGGIRPSGDFSARCLTSHGHTARTPPAMTASIISPSPGALAGPDGARWPLHRHPVDGGPRIGSKLYRIRAEPRWIGSESLWIGPELYRIGHELRRIGSEHCRWP